MVLLSRSTIQQSATRRVKAFSDDLLSEIDESISNAKQTIAQATAPLDVTPPEEEAPEQPQQQPSSGFELPSVDSLAQEQGFELPAPDAEAEAAPPQQQSMLGGIADAAGGAVRGVQSAVGGFQLPSFSELIPKDLHPGQDVIDQMEQGPQTVEMPATPGGMPGGTAGGGPDDVRAYVRQAALARGIDPTVAERVMDSEGGPNPGRQSNVVTGGKRETSFGPFQLYTGGGLGNTFQQRTGLDPSDPSAWRQTVDFALDEAAQGGWAPFHGAARVGIGNRTGLDGARPVGISAAGAEVPGTVRGSGQGSAATPLPAPGQSTSAAFDAQSIAQQWAGKQYVFGGAGGRGKGIADTDCSGFTSEVLGLPAHTDAAYAAMQKRGAVAVPEGQAAPGDPVFYMGAGTGGNVVHHIGIYAGPGKVLDMSTSGGGGVRVRDLGHAGKFEILRDPTDQRTPDPPQGAPAPVPIVPTPVQSGGVKPTPAQIDEWSQSRPPDVALDFGGMGTSGAQVLPPDLEEAPAPVAGPPVRDDYARTPSAGTSTPIINPDGSFTTERSITVTEPDLNGGAPTNIPTVWSGRVVDDDTAITNAVRSQNHWPSFGSIQAAEQAAQQRSSDLGAGRTTSIGGASLTAESSPQTSPAATVEPEPPFTAPAAAGDTEEPRDPWQRVGYALRDALGVAQSATSGASSAIAQTVQGAGQDLGRAGEGIGGALGQTGEAIGGVAGGIGNALTPASSTDLAQGAADIQQRQRTLPGTPEAEALAQQPMPFDTVGQEMQQRGIPDLIEQYQAAIRRGDTLEAVRLQTEARNRIALAAPDVRNQLLDAVLVPLGLGREQLGAPLGEAVKDVPGVNQLIPREARVGLADVVGNIAGGPGSPNAAIDAASAFGGAREGDIAGAIPLVLWGGGQLLPIVGRSVGPRLRDALEAFGRRTGTLTQDDVPRIAREVGEPVPSWINPETATQQLAAPEITGEMPRPLGGGLFGRGPAAGIAAVGRESDWWEQTYGGANKNTVRESQRIEAPLERLLEDSARSSPDGLAHPTPEQLLPLAVPKTQDGQVRPFPGGPAITTPTTLDDLRRARDLGVDSGAQTWYRDFHNDNLRLVGPQNIREADELFVSYSAILDPISARQLMLATMMKARDTQGGLAAMSVDDIKDVVQGLIRENNNSKGLLVMPNHFGNVKALYEAGEKAISAAKPPNFSSDFSSGEFGYIRDASSTNDVHMQRGQGYRGWDETGKQKLAQMPEVYRYGNTLTRWLAREKSMSPEEAQAAQWAIIQTSSLPNNVGSFAYARRLNSQTPEMAAAFKAAEPTWKAVAKAMKEERITLGEAIDQLEPLGVYRFTTPGSLAGVNAHPLTQRLEDVWKAGGYADMPMPGPAGRVTPSGLHHPGGPSTPWTAVGTHEGMVTSPFSTREAAQAPQISVQGMETGAPQPFLRDLRYPHRVATHGDVEGGTTVSFPTLNHERVTDIGQRLADESGAPVQVVRAPLADEAPNAVVFTIPRTAMTENPRALVDGLKQALGPDAQVQYDGQIVRVLSPSVADVAAFGQRLSQASEPFGVASDAISARGRYVEELGPTTERAAQPGLPGGQPGRPGGGRAADNATLFRDAIEGTLGRTVGVTAGAPDLARRVGAGVARGAAQGAVTGGYEASQQEGASPQSVALGVLAGAGAGGVRGGVGRALGPRGASTLARAAARGAGQAGEDDVTHVRGFGLLRGVDETARGMLERVAEKGRQYPEGVPWDEMDAAIKATVPDPDAVAKKWLQTDSRELASEAEVLHRGAAATIQEFMDDARRVTELNDSSPDVLMGAADRLTDAVVANEMLLGHRRIAESMGRGLNMLKNQIHAKAGRALFDSLDRTATSVERVADVIDGKVTGPRAGTILEQAADSLEAMGKQSDDADKVLARFGVTPEQARNLKELASGPERAPTERATPFVDPLAHEMKVREDMKRTLDSSIQKMLDNEKRTTVRTEVEDFARQARETMGEIIKNTSDQGLKDDLAETLGRMREHSNLGEQAAARLQQVFDQRMDTWASNYMKGVEGRIAGAEKKAKMTYNREQVAGLSAQLREMAGLARSGRDPSLLTGIDDLRIAMMDYGQLGRDRSTEVKQAITKQGLVRFAGKLDDDQLAKFQTLLRSINPDDPQSLQRVMSVMGKGTFTDNIIEYAVANMLSSPATQFINASSSLMQGTASLAVKKPLMIMLDPIVNRGDRQVYASEMGAAADGIGTAFGAGLRAFGETMRYGYSRNSMERAAQLGDFGGVRRELLTEKFGWPGAALHAISTRPLQAVDELLGNMLYSANLYSLAERRAIKTGVARQDILNDLASHLDLVGEAGKASDYSMLKSSDRVTNAIASLTHAQGTDGDGGRAAAAIATHLLFPFVKTPWNVLKQGIEFSPLGTVVNVGRTASSIAHGNKLEAVDRAANVAAGAGIAALGSGLWMAGQISGDGPTDLEKRRQLESEGWQPRSIRAPGGQWVSYDSTPFTIPLGSLVTGLERYQEAVDKGQLKGSPDAMWQGVMGFGLGTASSFANQSFVRNAADLVSGVQEGNYNPETTLASFASRYMPAGSMVAYLARLGDSVQRETRMADHPGIASLTERTPLRGTLPARQDVLGRERPNDQSVVRDLPSAVSNVLLPSPRRAQGREDPVIGEYQRLGVDLSAGPPPSITVDTVPIELNVNERQAFQRAYGDAVTRKMEIMTRGTGWQSATPAKQREDLERIKKEASEAARLAVQREIGSAELIRRKRLVRVPQ